MSKPCPMVVPTSSLAEQPWWTECMQSSWHPSKTSTLRTLASLPLTWTRLDPDPVTGAADLTKELGPHGHLVVVFIDDEPAACSGVVPFRGERWINDVKSADSDVQVTTRELTKFTAGGDIGPNPQNEFINPHADWEVLCFCVSVAHQGKDISPIPLEELIKTVKKHGAERLMSNYHVQKTGEFWLRTGFIPIPNAQSVLKRGFKRVAGEEGLRADVHFNMGAKPV